MRWSFSVILDTVCDHRCILLSFVTLCLGAFPGPCVSLFFALTVLQKSWKLSALLPALSRLVPARLGWLLPFSRSLTFKLQPAALRTLFTDKCTAALWANNPKTASYVIKKNAPFIQNEALSKLLLPFHPAAACVHGKFDTWSEIYQPCNQNKANLR